MFRAFYKEVKKLLNCEDKYIRESEFADLSTTIAFKIAKERKEPPQKVAEELVSEIEFERSTYIGSVEVVNGYINFFVNEEFLSDTVERILDEDENYGSLNLGGEVLIEHTSANPDGPLHVGHLRNAIIGDTLARMMEKAGMRVTTHYYVNDMGRQIAAAVLGYLKYGLSEKKPDHAVAEAYIRINRDIEENPELEKEVDELMLKFERGDEEISEKFRFVVDKALEGIKETLEKFDIHHDDFIYESDFVRNGYVERILRMLEEKGLLEKDDVWKVDLKDYGIEKEVILRRENGTTLYITRDLAYHLWKNENFERFINVLGADHKLYSEQLSKILELLGLKPPEVLFFEFVSLPEGSMSTRKGKFVSADELLEKTFEEAKKILRERGSVDERIAKIVAVGAIRYDFVKVSPEKPFTFDWSKALDFERQTASYIQYSHARACSILRKAVEAGRTELEFDPAIITKKERELVMRLSKFSFYLEKAVNELKPSVFAEYLMSVANAFNDFYTDHQVLVDDKRIRMHRLAIVDATRIVLRNGLELLGIEAPERM
ncbi:arginyl-tRNA synthetase [Ferroglobus placidus DSM 10642]|uniref:Arginine--tRNA ligase n=1 Tax=Ferroglobus placidus (strain DSM 10642 / AEDII12DO) TaxID=589924 RepID=D3S057_FERPA|nr:arginine--tRNA ligase [Ferroglobus placidus]ADC66120.1 arginyl-tRNA synthetase [Ferroglobus placidus DSM 10642]